MSFKIAVDAGHCLKTAGKELDGALDPAKTKEWVLNDRVVRHFIEAAKQYDDVEILRVDDPTGKTAVSLATRVKKANDWGADFYFSAHHNAGIELGTGGGIVAYCYRENTTASKYRDAIYKACIAAGGLVGNRSDPTLTASFYVIKYTKAPAVLMEYGFMDSRTDAPVILQDSYSEKMAYATMEGIAEVAGLKKTVTSTSQVDHAQKPAEKKDDYTLGMRILREGRQGEDVRALQLLLKAKGYDLGTAGPNKDGVDGKYGPKTKLAVQSYQHAENLKEDGVAGHDTMSHLLGVK